MHLLKLLFLCIEAWLDILQGLITVNSGKHGNRPDSSVLKQMDFRFKHASGVFEYFFQK